MTSPQGKHLRRVQRTDRLMAWVVSSGGLLILAAVLGILVFIAWEAFPLFRSPRVAGLGSVPAASTGAFLVEEDGRALLALDPVRGVQARRLPDGAPLEVPTGGPALPWRAVAPVDPAGRVALLGADGALHVGHLGWHKPQGEQDPARWEARADWQPPLPAGAGVEALLDLRETPASGLDAEGGLRIAARVRGSLAWAEREGTPAAPLVWHPLTLPEGETCTDARWSGDGRFLLAGTREGRLHLLDVTSEGHCLHSLAFGEPVSALGFAFGHGSLLVGGAKGRIAAVQVLATEQGPRLQLFHRFQDQAGAVLGFMGTLRDKRFLSWSADGLAVDHLTSEKRLLFRKAQDVRQASLSARGDALWALDGSGRMQGFRLEAPHAEVSAGTLLGRVHYESYARPEWVWQSTGGSDDAEAKLSLVPLLFGTLKGTLYALLFALPLAVLGALYTSQFATPRLKGLIKPAVEVMAALPSVVLGFIAGLVLAPLFERAALQVALAPVCILLAALACMPLASRLPGPWKERWIQGREVLWAVPVLFLGLGLSLALAPGLERLCFGGDLRHWLHASHGVVYDQRNSLVVGFAMGFAVIPIIFTIAEDALSAVPRSLTSASLACGASPWQTAWRVVLPTASPGIFSAAMVGLGRAIGETMIVLMATGNTPILDWSLFNGMRTLAANIAVEAPEAPVHGTLYRVLFLTALLLFALTFLLNTVAELVRQRLRKRYESL